MHSVQVVFSGRRRRCGPPSRRRSAGAAENALGIRTDPQFGRLGGGDDVQGVVGEFRRNELRHRGLGLIAGELVETHRHTECGGDRLRLLTRRHHLRPGELVGPAGVPVAQQAGCRNVGDVGRIDDRNPDVAEGGGNRPLRADGLGPCEGVGGEATRPQDRPLETRLLQGVLQCAHRDPRRPERPGGHALRGQQDDPADPVGRREADDVAGPGIGGVQITGEQEEQRLRPVQGGRQTRRPGQVGGQMPDSLRNRRGAPRHRRHLLARVGQGLRQRPADIPRSPGHHDHVPLHIRCAVRALTLGAGLTFRKDIPRGKLPT